MRDEIIVLGFDFGLRRIGVAVGEYPSNSTRPLTVLIANSGNPTWEHVDKLIRAWAPKRLALGIPLNMDGSEQAMTFAAREFGIKLQQRYHLPVDEVDERLTTREAKSRLQEAGKGRMIGKAALDHLAAEIILESWFELYTKNI